MPLEIIMEHNLLWDIIKFILTIIVIPFSIWIVKAHIDTKKDISTMKEDALKFKAEIAEKFAPKQEVVNLSAQLDTKITAMQNAVTQRIDTMQSNIATMIASLGKGN